MEALHIPVGEKCRLKTMGWHNWVNSYKTLTNPWLQKSHLFLLLWESLRLEGLKTMSPCQCRFDICATWAWLCNGVWKESGRTRPNALTLPPLVKQMHRGWRPDAVEAEFLELVRACLACVIDSLCSSSSDFSSYHQRLMLIASNGTSLTILLVTGKQLQQSWQTDRRW